MEFWSNFVDLMTSNCHTSFTPALTLHAWCFLQATCGDNNAPKKVRKGKVYVPKAPKLRSPEQILADEVAAHAETKRRLEAIKARLKKKEQECSACKALLQDVQGQVCDLSAQLQDKQSSLQLLTCQMSEAHEVATSLDATIAEMTARLVAQERRSKEQVCRSAAEEVAAQKQDLLSTAQQLSALQLAHQSLMDEITQYKLAVGSDLAAHAVAAEVSSSKLAQLEQAYRSAQDDLAKERAATFFTKTQSIDLELQLEYTTASLSQLQHKYESVSADLALQKASGAAAAARSAALELQLQESGNSLAKLKTTHSAMRNDLVQQQATAAASAAKVQQLEQQLQDATAQLEQLQADKAASLELLTDISTEYIVAHAACEYIMGQELEAAEAAHKQQKDKCAVNDAEIRAFRWKLARADASIKELLRQVEQLKEQQDTAANSAVQLRVQLQGHVWDKAAMLLQLEESESAACTARQQLRMVQEQLNTAQEQLLGCSCAEAALSLTCDHLAGTTDASAAVSAAVTETASACRAVASAAPAADGAALISDGAGLINSTSTTPAVNNLSPPVFPAVATLRAVSKPVPSLPSLFKPLNKVFKKLGMFCVGGTKHTTSSHVELHEIVIHHDPVFDSFMAGPRSLPARNRRMSIHGIADLVLLEPETKADPVGLNTVAQSSEECIIGHSNISRWGSEATAVEGPSAMISSSPGSSKRASATDPIASADCAGSDVAEDAVAADEDVAAADNAGVTAMIVSGKAGGTGSKVDMPAAEKLMPDDADILTC